MQSTKFKKVLFGVRFIFEAKFKKVLFRGVVFMIEYFNYKQAMEYMNIKSKSTFGKYLANGLPTIQVGKSKRISKSDIDKFMAEHRVVATQNK